MFNVFILQKKREKNWNGLSGLDSRPRVAETVVLHLAVSLFFLLHALNFDLSVFILISENDNPSDNVDPVKETAFITSYVIKNYL